MTDSRRILRTLGMLTLAAALGACGSGGGDAAADGTSAGGGSGSTAAAGSGATGSTGAGSGSGAGTGTGSGAGTGSSSGTGTGSSSGTGTGSASGSGGSGSAGGSGASSGGPAAAANVPPAGTLQVTAPAANYAPGSTESAAWSNLNAERVAAGAGWLVQSNELDTAAAAHTNYLVRNIGATGHAEAQDKIDYYEASPGSRVTKAGFAASFTTETISDYRPSVLGILQGPDCAVELLNSVYNAVALLGPATHVGLRGWDGTFSGAQFCLGLVAAPQTRPEGQVVPAGRMVAYPYDGQSGVIESVNLQVESPRPSGSALPNDLAGAPVIVNVRNADYLNLGLAGSLNVQVTKFELSDPSSGNLLPAAILAHAALKGSGVVLVEDPNLPVGAVVLVPLSPLLRGHVYTVSFAATLKDGGPALQKTWSFTTRP